VWPLAARAQQPAMPVVGFLASASEYGSHGFVAAFRNGLVESGYVEGRDVQVEYRWADNQYDRLSSLAADLVRRSVSVIVASGGPAAPLAAKAATSTIPIVFTATSDPVRLGLVASLNRPGGNVTGTGAFTVELDAKRLEVLRELVPKVVLIGALINPNRPDADAQSQHVQNAARAVGQQVHVLMAGSEREIDTAFTALAQQQIGALLVGADPFFSSRRNQVVALAARHTVPTVYMNRDFVATGGLASYGTNIADGYRPAGIYAAQILKGAKPADLPVIQPTKFELAINLKTAKALGLTVPPTLLARADEVIE
jgi:putative tryptophan/tyrosine transport system substrate-binding protein